MKAYLLFDLRGFQPVKTKQIRTLIFTYVRGKSIVLIFTLRPYNFQLTASAGFNGHKQFTFTVLIVFRQSLFIAPLHLTKQINRAVFINDDSVKRPVMYILLLESELQAVLGNREPKGRLGP